MTRIRASLPGKVAARFFDFDHLRAKVGHQLTRIRSRNHVTTFNHANTVQRAGGLREGGRLFTHSIPVSTQTLERKFRSSILISGQTRFDFNRPGINAPGKTHDLLKVVLTQEVDNVQTPHPMMAVGHNLGIRIEFVQAAGDITHRNVNRVRKLNKSNFFSLSHIKQHKVFTGVSFGVEFVDCDFERHQALFFSRPVLTTE